MDQARHQRLSDLFAEARRLDPQDRAALLDRVEIEDAALGGELRGLVAQHEAAPSTSDFRLPGALRAILAQVDVGQVDRAEPPEAHEPSSIGRYTVLRQLGEGGMGVVYLAEQDRPRRLVALKIMRQGFGRATASMRRRFELETQLLARLEHPGIARLYDAGTAPLDGGTPGAGGAAVPYFAMEFVDGRPLLEHAKAAGLNLRDRMRLIQKICEAVAAAHRQGVVHRDLKPGNILVDASGQPKILDFGVARAVGGDAAVTTAHTDVGQLIGTLPYMSPEQVAGDPGKIDARCDVYALGVVTYELLSGKLPLPVRDVTVAEAARQIRDEDPVPLASIDRGLRGDVDTIVAKAMEKEPDRRYQTADALGSDIARWLSDEPISARPPTTMYQFRKFARRNRGLVAGIVVAFVMLVAGLVGTSWGLVQARREAILAREASNRADRERDAALEAEARATRRFNDVRKLAKAFIYDVHDGIVDLPGSTAVRKEIVTKGLEYLDSLAQEAGDDLLLRDEVAEAYIKIGQAQGYHARGNLGDRAAALESFRKARRMREVLVASDPANQRWLVGLLTVRNYIANIHFSDGRYEEALKEFDDVRRERERIVEMNAGDPEKERDARRAVSISWQWIGNALKYLDRKEEALEAYRNQFRISNEIVREGDLLTTRDLTVAYEKVGDALRDLDRTEEALVEYEASLAVRRKLAEANPENGELRTDLGVSLGRIGRVRLAVGDTEGAAQPFSESREILAAMAAADPENVMAQANWSISEYRLAEVAAARAEKAGSAAEAAAFRAEGVAQADKALAILEALEKAGRLEARFKEGIREFSELRQKLVDANGT